MSGQNFPAGAKVTGADLTDIVYVNRTGVSAQSVGSGSDTTTSGSYANCAGTSSITSFSFTKANASTNVIVDVDAGFVSAGGTSVPRFGVLVNGTDYDCSQNLQTTGAYGQVSGFAIITGLAAGTYTIQGRWKRAAGAGTPTRDVNTWYALSASETT